LYIEEINIVKPRTKFGVELESDILIEDSSFIIPDEIQDVISCYKKGELTINKMFDENWICSIENLPFNKKELNGIQRNWNWIDILLLDSHDPGKSISQTNKNFSLPQNLINGPLINTDRRSSRDVSRNRMFN